jgi:hypothetical protein
MQGPLWELKDEAVCYVYFLYEKVRLDGVPGSWRGTHD